MVHLKHGYPQAMHSSVVDHTLGKLLGLGKDTEERNAEKDFWIWRALFGRFS